MTVIDHGGRVGFVTSSASSPDCLDLASRADPSQPDEPHPPSFDRERVGHACFELDWVGRSGVGHWTEEVGYLYSPTVLRPN